MKPELREELDKLYTYEMALASNGHHILVLDIADVEDLLNRLTKGDYCGVCGGGLSLDRHDD